MNKKKIMLVEDDEALSAMYRVKFENAGFEVEICTNGITAITDITEFMPDVILMDIMMPSMDGIETLSTIRHLAPTLKTKIIMFSNLNSKAEIDECMKMWADAYITKADTTPKQALDLINNILGLCETKEHCAIVPNPQSNTCFVVESHCPNCQHNIQVTVDLS